MSIVVFAADCAPKAHHHTCTVSGIGVRIYHHGDYVQRSASGQTLQDKVTVLNVLTLATEWQVVLQVSEGDDAIIRRWLVCAGDRCFHARVAY